MLNIYKAIKEFIRILSRKRRLRQSLNLLRYRLSGKNGETLSYKPVYLTILPIHRCNLSCRMCLTHSSELGDHPFRHRVFNDMPFDMFKDIIRRFPEALAVGFMGNGEPLLNSEIFEMIDYANKKGRMYTSMITNGVLLNKFREKILGSRLREICISINGHNRTEFSRMTAMPATIFEKIIASSKELINRRDQTLSRLKVNASAIIDSVNIEYIQDIVDYSCSLGFDEVSLYNILPLTLERAKKVSLWNDDRTIEAIKKVTTPKTKTKINLPVPLDGKTDNNVCIDFFSSINIDGEGNVGGCNRQKFNISKVGKYWDKDVFNNEYFRRERLKFLNRDGSLDEPCKVCFANSSYIFSLKDINTHKE